MMITMMMSGCSSSMFFYLLLLLSTCCCFPPGVLPANLIFSNNCGYQVWPGLSSSSTSAALSTTGFALPVDSQPVSVATPATWNGRVWGRTGCTATRANLTCATADCGSGKLECAGAGPSSPATLAEFSIGAVNGQDLYDVSLVSGFNIPILVTPGGGGTGPDCKPTGCSANLSTVCPPELTVAVGSDDVACMSACDAFGDEQYCCRREYGTASKCKPTRYARFFKSVCPRAYSYPFDDATSTFYCGSSPDYLITFCASPTTT
uniref:Thaumatin-like protein n=2 Tax=Kalanchoe fedtschenkoi TaxID=63787 RepID=A0A7N0U2V1_KALFE